MELKETIGRRIRAEREKRGFSQGKLAEALDWNNHQTVVSIESGQREVKAWELAKIAKFLGVNLVDLLEDHDTEKALPYVLWRDVPVEQEPEIKALFIRHCEDYHFLEQALGISDQGPKPLPVLPVNILEMGYEYAEEQASFIRHFFNLGRYPAVTLAKTLEDYFGVKFLQFDLGKDGSAASTKSEMGFCILVNSSQIPWRQNFSVAHELFHVLTWNETIFKQNEENKEFTDKNEKMANVFAAALLLPKAAIEEEMRKIVSRGEFQTSDLVAIARKFDVSVKALLYRLEELKFITAETRDNLWGDPEVQNLDMLSPHKIASSANRLGDRLWRLAYQAYNRDKISRARMAEILDVPLASLKRHLEEKGLPESANHAITLYHS